MTFYIPFVISLSAWIILLLFWCFEKIDDSKSLFLAIICLCLFVGLTFTTCYLVEFSLQEHLYDKVKIPAEDAVYDDISDNPFVIAAAKERAKLVEGQRKFAAVNIEFSERILDAMQLSIKDIDKVGEPEIGKYKIKLSYVDYDKDVIKVLTVGLVGVDSVRYGDYPDSWTVYRYWAIPDDETKEEILDLIRERMK